MLVSGGMADPPGGWGTQRKLRMTATKSSSQNLCVDLPGEILTLNKLFLYYTHILTCPEFSHHTWLPTWLLWKTPSTSHGPRCETKAIITAQEFLITEDTIIALMPANII